MTIACAKAALFAAVWARAALGALRAGRYCCKFWVAQLMVSGSPSSMVTWMAIALTLDSCLPSVHNALQAHKHAVEAASLPMSLIQCQVTELMKLRASLGILLPARMLATTNEELGAVYKLRPSLPLFSSFYCHSTAVSDALFRCWVASECRQQGLETVGNDQMGGLGADNQLIAGLLYSHPGKPYMTISPVLAIG